MNLFLVILYVSFDSSLCLGLHCVRLRNDRVETTVCLRLCKTPSGVQVGGIAFFPFGILHVRRITLLSCIEIFEIFFVAGALFIVGALIVFIFIVLRVFTACVSEFFRKVVIVLLEVMQSLVSASGCSLFPRPLGR